MEICPFWTYYRNVEEVCTERDFIIEVSPEDGIVVPEYLDSDETIRLFGGLFNFLDWDYDNGDPPEQIPKALNSVTFIAKHRNPGEVDYSIVEGENNGLVWHVDPTQAIGIAQQDVIELPQYGTLQIINDYDPQEYWLKFCWSGQLTIFATLKGIPSNVMHIRTIRKNVYPSNT